MESALFCHFCLLDEADLLHLSLKGKKQGASQLINAAEGYVVKDDIEYAYQHVIPLWMFGFVY